MENARLRPDREVSTAYYEKKLEQYGEDVRALWGSLESQQVRFAVLKQIGDLDSKKVLDVGCGFGDFYGFLREGGVTAEGYVGVDISPKMVDIARRRFQSAKFEVRDILDDPFDDGSFDFVVASGIFSLESSNWEQYARRMLTTMYRMSRVGVTANFLSAFTTGEKPANSHFVNPSRILEFVFRKLSTRVVLRHDYRPNDFTVYIYKPFA